ncbi:MAG: DUF1566 domain-containing protein [Pseudomonadales bacterium]|nr:DUF1566 domain-containing protein [Pseudomonadales bacterium]
MIKRLLIVIGIVGVLLGYAALNPFAPGTPPTNIRWIKIDNQGNQLKAWDGPWACVYDKSTKLLWEVKTDMETIHDGYWSYSWFNGDLGAANKGDCYFEEERCDTNDLIRRTNQQLLCGLDQWRLPSEKELMSLVYHKGKPGDPTIAKDYFPQTKRGDYWTSASQQPLKGAFKHLGTGATAINFIRGTKANIPYRNAAFVRLVHSGFELPVTR